MKTPHKDPRYTAARVMLQHGYIKTFSGIFEWIPYTIVARDLKTNNGRMKKIVEDVHDIKFSEIITLAGLIKYDVKKLMLLAGEQIDKAELRRKLTKRK